MNKILAGSRKSKIVLLISAVVLSGVLTMGLVQTFAGTGTGVSYNWKTGQVLSDFKKVSSMPADWDFVNFTYKDEKGTNQQYGIWVPIGEPMIASRPLQVGDSGDDVRALQNTINAIRTEDKKDPYYFDKVGSSGVFDQGTVYAVYVLQDFYGYEKTGIADLNFQTSLYQQAITPATD